MLQVKLTPGELDLIRKALRAYRTTNLLSSEARLNLMKRLDDERSDT